jgi:AraC-like DNA-binding protein
MLLDACGGPSYARALPALPARDDPVMNRISFFRAAVLQPFVSFLRSAGAPVGRYLAEARVDPGLLADPEGIVPSVFVLRFVELAARRSGIADLGIRVGLAIDPFSLGRFGRTIASAGTVGRAFASSVTHRSGWHSGERVWIARNGDLVEVHHKYCTPEGEIASQAVAANLVAHLNLLRHTRDPSCAPAYVALPVARSRAYAEIPMLGNVRIDFDQPRTVIAFHPRTLAQPLVDVDATHQAKSLAEPTALPASLVPSVEAFVASLLGVQQPRIELVAEATGTNCRTLQRRLSEAGTTYGGLVAHTRLRLARERLAASDEKIVDIALALGYTDAAHFTRAFKRWTGLAPFAYRAVQAGTSHARHTS